jgi:transposase
MGRYAGVDWASEKHDVFVQDADGERVLVDTFAHDERGISALCGTLVRLKVELVAIERPDGLLVERLLDAGLRVMAIHPNQVHAARPRFRPAGGKSDAFDAFVLCELARTDSHRFRVLVPDSDETKALRALTRAREDLVQNISELTSEIAHRVRAHPDGPIFLSLFRDPKSVICAAMLLAEIGDCRGRYPTPEALAADAGMSPVAVESGKRKVACFRRGADKRLRDATSTLADATRHWHPWAQDRYATARARGQDHPRAIRTLGRAWCRVLWRCWQDHTPYDPARHRGLQTHITVTTPSQSGPRPDMIATQRMPGAAVTRRAAHRAEREALDGKPTSATTPGG